MLNKILRDFITCVVFLVLAQQYTSCGDNIFNERFRRPDPFPGTITIDNLIEGKSVHLKWEADEGADKYRVMRAVNDGGAVIFIERHDGTNGFYYQGATTAIDGMLEEDKSYAYRLDKIRGNQIFEGKTVTFLEKARPDPFAGTVKIQNMNNGRSAYITWEEDRGADEYRIMRAINDGTAIVFTERQDGIDGFYYQGVTSAIDSMLEDDKGYFYRLDKKRDGLWIPGLEITIFSRSRPMPIAATPVTESFRADGNIFISWQYDEGADAYLLMRSFDNPLTSSLDPYVPVYEGTELKYLDTNVNDQQTERYVYKLYKVRNGLIYKWDHLVAFGVASKTQEDNHEPNNLETQATLLETYRMGNIYCFGFSIPNTFLEDMDWFKVNVPPGKVANIAVQYTNLANDGYFLLYVPFFETRTITHLVSFSVRNDESVQKDVTFAIIPDRSRFLQVNGTGGSVAGYTIVWQSIDNI
jgi:hypothetical protein